MPEHVIQRLINTPDMDDSRSGGYTPLHRACQYAQVDTVKLLLQEGADPNAWKNNGSTPLMSAVASRGMHIRNGGLPPPQKDFVECAKLLLKHEKFDRKRNDDEAQLCSPVWAAVNLKIDEDDAEANVLTMLNQLLWHGFKPDPVIKEESALHMAIAHGYLRCAKELVLAGADVLRSYPPLPGTVPHYITSISALELCQLVAGNGAAAELEAAYRSKHPHVQRADVEQKLLQEASVKLLATGRPPPPSSPTTPPRAAPSALHAAVPRGSTAEE